MEPLSLRQVALRLGLSLDRTRTHVRNGKIKAFRPGGGKWLVLPEDLEKFILSTSNQAQDPASPTGQEGGLA